MYGSRKGRRLWRRFKAHYTPKHASWLNQAEIEIILYRDVAERCREILKNSGINQANYRLVAAELERLPETSHLRQRLSRVPRRH